MLCSFLHQMVVIQLLLNLHLVHGNDIGDGISAQCTAKSKTWTSCLLKNPSCLSQQCDEKHFNENYPNYNNDQEEDLDCGSINQLCKTVLCCEECHILGLELLNCEADARTCSNECLVPTAQPSAVPSRAPSSSPSSAPSLSVSPSAHPTSIPSVSPSRNPTSSPSSTPTKTPSASPTSFPTKKPSSSPSQAPTTSAPTPAPTPAPTTSAPTPAPTPAPIFVIDTTEPLVGRSDFRCGINEADARSNCKKSCFTSADCPLEENCWATHFHYCHALPSNHPQCPSESAEDENRRCGVDEMSARGFCGQTCNNVLECTGEDEICLPVMRNMCQCFEDQGVLNQVVPSREQWTPSEDLTPPPKSSSSSQLTARSDYRCGETEADARSNCKSECVASTDCGPGETCWITHVNFCHTMPPNQPQCPASEAENVSLRCGHDELTARAFCGNTCTNNLSCPDEEICIPVIRNMCNCYEDRGITDEVIPDKENFLSNAGYGNSRRNLMEIQQQKKEHLRLRQNNNGNI
eukprot:CAMPEP_0194132764 /NCGR_PEP_ID=MMETSP0152-20130528/3158_1 /TAXON_ID=1049557 /ORGANISM="Thalassiothrix antarctica, Strain L6-D1" /LENGTH=519 /DNA_ID=CAMNT_0038827925 /DNA_START=114 /DNA_END=1673 /DNA_ORIENTATION=-